MNRVFLEQERKAGAQYIKGKTIKEIAESLGLSEEKTGRIIRGWKRRIKSRWRHIGFYENWAHKAEERVEILENIIKELKEGIAKNGNRIPETPSETKYISGLLNDKLTIRDFSRRAKEAFRAAEIETFADLVQYDIMDLLKFSNVGTKTIEEIKNCLHKKGLEIGMDITKYEINNK